MNSVIDKQLYLRNHANASAVQSATPLVQEALLWLQGERGISPGQDVKARIERLLAQALIHLERPRG